MTIIQEHSVCIDIELPKGHVHANMKVFYNPVMASHRNISILLLNSLPKKKWRIADPLAGSGIRVLRFLKELSKGNVKEIIVNDHKENFPAVLARHLKLNKIKTERIAVHCQDASLFLLQQEGFDYIDVDPFGSPNPFLAAAVARISREGILAVTATDTAALTGTYPAATRRNYWATPLRNYLMHEIGLRILIRKIQLQGMQFDKALVPVLAYFKDHYFRVYLEVQKGKERCDEILQQHHYFLFCKNCYTFTTSVFNKEKCSCGKQFEFAGPLWAGRLFDQRLLKAMVQNNPYPEEQKFVETLQREAAKDIVGFYDLHILAAKFRKDLPKMELVQKKVDGVRTHFSPTGIKTEKKVNEVLAAFGQTYTTY